jgi:hypothetical protein
MRIGEERRREARRGKERRGEERGFESSSLPPYLHRHQPLGEKHVGALNALDCRSTERNIKNHNAYNGNSKVQYFFYAFEWHVQDPATIIYEGSHDYVIYTTRVRGSSPDLAQHSLVRSIS